MSGRALVLWLGGYFVVLTALCFVVRGVFGLTVDPATRGAIIASVWRRGELVERAVIKSPDERDPRLEKAREEPGASLVYETIVAEGPILTNGELLFGISLVPGRDGIKASLGSETAYFTPDEFLARQGYDKGTNIPDLGLALGADIPLAMAFLAERLHTSVAKLKSSASFRRIRVERTTPGATPPPNTLVTADALTPGDVTNAVVSAAAFLARGQSEDGRFRYMVDAPTNKTLNGYDWPRHAGATYFLAQAASLTKDPALAEACLRAASLLRDKAMQKCHMAKCIGTDEVVEIGSSALGLLAFAEIVRTGLDPSYLAAATDLAHFLRAQQRADGEFMHEFDRVKSRAIDVQYLYFSGEATLALARAASLGEDPAAQRNRDAAALGLWHLVGPAWHFFGDRYYFGEEHWTCQAVDELWDRAPDAKALDFCLRWQAYGRKMQYESGDTPYDADGAFGVGPLVTPRLTPVGSRCEAGVATLAAARRAHVADGEIAALSKQLRRSIALLVRQQLLPGEAGGGVAHLLADPAAIRGGMPGSPVDWQLRIDYAQHAGSAMIRWLEVEGSVGASSK